MMGFGDIMFMLLPLWFALGTGVPKKKVKLDGINGAVIVGFALFGVLIWAVLLYFFVFPPADKC